MEDEPNFLYPSQNIWTLRIRNAKYIAKHTWNFIDTSVSIEHLWFSHNQNECCYKMVHMNGNLTNRYIFKNTGTKRSLHNMLWTILENSLWILQKGVSKCLNSIFWWLVLESWVSNFKTLSGFFPMVSGNFQKHEAIFFKIDFSIVLKYSWIKYSHWSLLKLLVFCCDISWFNSLYWIYSVCHSGTFDANSFQFVIKIPPRVNAVVKLLD